MQIDIFNQTIEQIFPQCQFEEILKYDYKKSTIKVKRKDIQDQLYVIKLYFFQQTKLKRSNVNKLVRVMKTMSINQSSQFLKQYELSFDIAHTYFGLVQEYNPISLKSLIQAKKANREYFEEDQIWIILKNLIKALLEWQPMRFSHLRIKSSSIYQISENQYQLGECDINYYLTNTFSLNSMFYQNYDILNSQTPNKKTDIWSLGCVIYELMRFNLPYLGQNLDDIRSSIKQDYNQKSLLEDVNYRYSKRLNFICRAMLSINEDMRPSLEQISQYVEENRMDGKMLIGETDKHDNYSLRYFKYFNKFTAFQQQDKQQFRCKTFFKPGRLLRTQKKIDIGERSMIGQPRPVKTFNDVNQDTGNEYELQPFLARMPSINKRLKEISAYNYYKRQNTEYNKHSKEILQSNGLTRTEQSSERDEHSFYKRFKKVNDQKQFKQKQTLSQLGQFKSEKSIFLHQIIQKIDK